MDASLAITIASVCIVALTLFASFLIKDQPDAKPARYCFRLFYLFGVLFFITIAVERTTDIPNLDVATDFFLGLLNALMLHAIAWRCNSKLPLSFIYSLAVIYLLSDTLIKSADLEIGYAYNAITALLGSYLLFNRKPVSNVGDKAMAIVMILWTISLVINITPLLGNGNYTDNQFYLHDAVYTFIYAPAYVSGFSVFLISSYMIDNQKILERQATTDSLTGLYNRRFFNEEVKRLQCLGKTLNIIICDIDNLKIINDKFGHNIGDEVLQEFGLILATLSDRKGVAARFGGDEFVILLSDMSTKESAIIAENMRLHAEQITIKVNNKTMSFSASFGVSQLHQDGDIEQAIKNADDALYRAKNNNRNQVQLA